MNEQIASFPSDHLYEHALISDPSVAHHTLLDLPGLPDVESEDAKDALEHPVIFFDTAGCEFYEQAEGDDSTDGQGKRNSIGEGSKANANEAEVVVRWARQLVSPYIP